MELQINYLKWSSISIIQFNWTRAFYFRIVVKPPVKINFYLLWADASSAIQPLSLFFGSNMECSWSMSIKDAWMNVHYTIMMTICTMGIISWWRKQSIPHPFSSPPFWNTIRCWMGNNITQLYSLRSSYLIHKKHDCRFIFWEGCAINAYHH